MVLTSDQDSSSELMQPVLVNGDLKGANTCVTNAIVCVNFIIRDICQVCVESVEIFKDSWEALFL